MLVGKRRQTDKHLPQRVYVRHGKFYYYFKPADARRLGRTRQYLGASFGEAMVGYGKVDLDRPTGDGLMASIFDRFLLEEVPNRYGKDKPEEHAARLQADVARQLTRLRRVFGEMHPDDVTKQHVYQYLDHRPQFAGNREVSLLSVVFKKAHRWGFTQNQPCQGIEKNRERQRAYLPTEADVAAVLALAPRVVGQMIRFAVITGLRQGDIRELTVDAITDDGIRCEPSKTRRTTGKTLIVEWSDELRQLVAEIRDRPVGSRFLFLNEHHRPWTLDGFQSAWQRLMARAVAKGVHRFRFHDLRAASASWDVDGAEAARRLAHADPATTARIYRRLPEKVRPLKRR